MEDNPILNNPYEEPQKYYGIDPEAGSLDYSTVTKCRETFIPEIPAVPMKLKGQKGMFDVANFQPR